VNPKELDFKEVKENWNRYALSDGATLKLKIVLVKVIQEEMDSRGNQSLGFQATNVVGVTPSDEMIWDKSLDKDENIGSEVIDEEWNEYHIDKGVTVMLKPFVSQVIRTGDLDPKGIPIYLVQAQPLIKLKTP
jgi:hypothetical protein